MERRALKRLVIVGGVIVATCLLVGTVAVRARTRAVPAAADPAVSNPNADAPAGTRVRVEVLNATVVHGLARRATLLLRDHGFDVVTIGSSSERLDSVAVLDRSGHPDWAARVAAALGGARVEERPDTSRYVDVTVLLGTRWHPPAKPFYP